jgi:hypothetical protein
MPQPNRKLKTAHDQALAGSAYYTVFSIEKSQDEPGKWDVLFFVSGSKTDVDAPCPLSDRAIKNLLQLSYAFTPDRPEISCGEGKNLHMLRCDSKERAERAASELVYILQDAGVDPMKIDERKFVPMAPETSKPRFDPPKNPPGHFFYRF